MPIPREPLMSMEIFFGFRRLHMFPTSTPLKTNMDTQNDGLAKVTPFYVKFPGDGCTEV